MTPSMCVSVTDNTVVYPLKRKRMLYLTVTDSYLITHDGKRIVITVSLKKWVSCFQGNPSMSFFFFFLVTTVRSALCRILPRAITNFLFETDDCLLTSPWSTSRSESTWKNHLNLSDHRWARWGNVSLFCVSVVAGNHPRTSASMNSVYLCS